MDESLCDFYLVQMNLVELMNYIGTLFLQIANESYWDDVQLYLESFLCIWKTFLKSWENLRKVFHGEC